MNNQRLKNCRENMHLSLSYVANLLALTSDELQQIEEGNRCPTEEQWLMIERLYGCSKAYFFKKNQMQPIEGLTDHDAKQMQEFFAFQQIVAKKNKIT